MDPSQSLTDDILGSFLKCRYKAYLKLHRAAEESSEYKQLQTRLAAEYRLAAGREMLRSHYLAAPMMSTMSLEEAPHCQTELMLDVAVDDTNQSCRLDALERSPGGEFTPILFNHRQQITADDRLRLAFMASILGRVHGLESKSGRIVHGPKFRSTRVSLPVLAAQVQDAIDQIQAIRHAATAPPMVLNRHCPECEFRLSCRARAVEKDDLSLLRGLSAKEIAGLNGRGIFTVTQLSYTFRTGRLKRTKERHEHALQALAIREKTVYVARRPQLPDGKVRAYLDVEGLPDRDFYYLIGLFVDDGAAGRRFSFWADREVNEEGIWNSFLEVVRGLGNDFVLYHYGSYETHFLEQMWERHGGDHELQKRLKVGMVNVLSAIHSRIYFPIHANDLKTVAGCLGFQWSAADASGLQSIVWRHAWEEIGDETTKARLLTYNQDDCSALAVVTAAVRSFAADSLPELTTGLIVAATDDIAPPAHRKYGNSTFAIPEFARITKCAYFDYQRNKVLCRTNPKVKMSIAREKRTRSQKYRINQKVECEDVKVCPYCNSTVLDTNSKYRRCVIDLKPFRGGLKRWVTRYQVIRRRCRRCWKTFLPEHYRALPSKYGPGLCNWVVYASISLRLTNDAAVEALLDLFGIRMNSAFISRIRQQAVTNYRPTYEGLLTALRKGSLVHADETKVEIKGLGNAYVWVFASPDTAVYVYAPTREAVTVAETLNGFVGVLVSDFYAAYDSVDCQQQKCLIHLIRDLNDDILKNPFDEELKQLATGITAVLQPVIATIDRFGLKKYHLSKHKPSVECFFAAVACATYHSETARHYRSRFIKYRHKLFTFLDHDGIPWNNNNAENAIKLFASRRKVMGTQFTKRGIKDHLLLLSLYQTLRYRGLGFWKFLLSGETDLAAYTAKCR